MTTKFRVGGMSCASCASHVENAVRGVPGVVSVCVNLLTGSMTAEHDCPPDAIVAAVARAGFSASVWEEKPGESPLPEEPHNRVLPRLCASVALTLPLLYLSMGHMLGAPLPPFADPAVYPLSFLLLQFLLATAVAVVNYRYFTGGALALFRRAPNMDTLVALGAFAAWAHGLVFLILAAVFPDRAEGYAAGVYLEAVATILTLVTVGKTLEGQAKNKTLSAIRALAALRPETAVVRREGRDVTLPLADVAAGDELVLRAGDRIGVDGTLRTGNLTVDESSVTGESLPVEKSPGDVLLSGCTVLDGFGTATADRVGEDTSLSSLIRMVRDAAAGKAPIARTADRVAAVFVPAVLGIAAVTFAVWLVIALVSPSTATVSGALERAITVLVISCPCALGLATPTAIMTATGRGAGLGILVKDAAALEHLGRTETVVFDKTGTLTTGEMRVSGELVCPGTERDEFRAVLFALEGASAHPIARAVAAFAQREAAGSAEAATDFAILPGRGVFARVGGDACLAGNAALMEDYEFDLSPLDAFRRSAEETGATVVFVSRKTRLLGAVSVEDTVRQESAGAVTALAAMGIRTVMLTGDNPRAAGKVAAETGIAEVYAELTPEQKALRVKELEKDRRVMMVGDGINDAPSLAIAAVGAAIGAGTDVAIASGDVILRRSSPMDAVRAVRLGRATLRNIRENLFWALLYNSIGIPLAAGVLAGVGVTLTPMIAAVAMSLSSVSVVCNALRLRRFR